MSGRTGRWIDIAARDGRDRIVVKGVTCVKRKYSDRRGNQRKVQGAPDAAFVCEHCQQTVAGAPPGTEHRNHCPWCLWSVHLDIRPGDRRSSCRDLMEPIAVAVARGGEWLIVHRCGRCKVIRVNRIGGDDSELVLMSLAARPLAQPPFPLDRLALSASDR